MRRSRYEKNNSGESIMLKGGKNTKAKPSRENLLNADILSKNRIQPLIKGLFIAVIRTTIEYKTEREGIKKANVFKRLVANPLVDLDIKFKKITK